MCGHDKPQHVNPDRARLWIAALTAHAKSPPRRAATEHDAALDRLLAEISGPTADVTVYPTGTAVIARIRVG
ncbi:MAG: hypothetical protein H6810_11945 [Phycisphaeraceae bacterium]|nr:MAG: hypothetical protein H6810_11945 [Phycisphaeraceae bacterium]